MNNIVIPVLICVAILVIGGVLLWKFLSDAARTRSQHFLQKAKEEAEVIKKNKLLEVKEQFIKQKAALEREVAQRQSKIQSIESKLKNRDEQLSERQQELNRKIESNEQLRKDLELRMEELTAKEDELAQIKEQQLLELQHIAGLTAEQARESS